MEKIYVYHEYNDNTPTGMITKVSFDKQELLDYLKDRADLFTRNSRKFGCSLEKLQEDIKCGLYSDKDAEISDDYIFCNEHDTNYYWKVIEGETIKQDKNRATHTWIIAIENTASDGVRMFRANGDVCEIKNVLIRLALEDQQGDEENFDYGTENFLDVEETFDAKINEVTELEAYNVFSDYHIDYTAQRLDSMKPCKA